jgi:hypothetical protein
MDELTKLWTFVNLDRSRVLATRVQMARTSRERRRDLLGVTYLHDDDGLRVVLC